MEITVSNCSRCGKWNGAVASPAIDPKDTWWCQCPPEGERTFKYGDDWISLVGNPTPSQAISLLLALTVSEVLATKNKIKEFLSDQSNSLDERWTLFMTAPCYLLESYEYIVRYEALSYFQYDYKKREWGRGTVVDVKDIVECLEEGFGTYHQSTDSYTFDPCIKDAMDKLKSEILKKGCRTFTYDW